MNASKTLCLCIALLLASSATAHADGPLRLGEIVFAVNSGSPVIGRVHPDAPLETLDSVSTVAGVAVAIASPNKIYALGANAAADVFEVWAIDVRSEETTLVGTVPLTTGHVADLAIQPDGRLLVVVLDTIEGRLYRIDPQAPEPATQEAVLVASDERLAKDPFYAFAPSLRVSAQGQVFVHGVLSGVLRLDGTTLQEVWPGVNWGTVEFWHAMDIDHRTGDLILGWFGFARVNPSDPVFSPVVTLGPDTLWNGIAIRPDGDLVFGHLLQLHNFDTDTGDSWDVANAPGYSGRFTFAVLHPQCSNGLDDDHDGNTDLDDPGCLGDLDRNTEVTGCSDGLDNDGDALIDTLDTEDCPTEVSDGEIPACADGSDNDGDHRRDSDDPDCMDGFDDSEVPECSDGIDNDGDSGIDHDGGPGGAPMDEQCVYGAEHDCEGFWECPDKTGLCENGWDDDGDGYVDAADSDCIGGVSEIPACDDGIDNDGDELTDLNDPDCDSLTGRGELPDCYDELDNDMDGLVDLADPGCTDKDDLKELPECSDGLDNDGDGTVDFALPPVANINGSFEQGWNPEPYFDVLYSYDGHNHITGWTVQGSVDYVKGRYWSASHGSRSLDLNGEYQGAIYRSIDTAPNVQYEVSFDLASNNGGGSPNKVARVSAAGTQQDFPGASTWQREHFFFTATDTTTVLRFSSVSATYWWGPKLDNVTVTPVALPVDTECSDADDNTEAVYECSDGIDNDGDGKIDWDGGPSGQPDHDCTGPRDDIEAHIPSPPCSMGSVPGDGGPTWLLALFGLLLLRRRRHRLRFAHGRNGASSMATHAKARPITTASRTLLACLALLLANAATAHADGPLRLGEIVFAVDSGSPVIGRVHPDAPLDTLDAVSTVAGLAVAIASPNKIYALGANPAADVFEVWAIDVRSEEATLVGTVPLANGRKADLDIEPDGRLVVIAQDPAEGRIYRIDPQEPPTQEADLLVSDSRLALSHVFGGGIPPSLRVNAQGQVFVNNLDTGVFRFDVGTPEEAGTLEEVWPGVAWNASEVRLKMDIDHRTGDLILGGIGLARVDPNDPVYSPVLSAPINTLWSGIAIRPDGDLVFGGSGQVQNFDADTGDSWDVANAPGYSGRFTFAVLHPQCSNGLDDDHDGNTDLDDPGCLGDLDRNTEVTGCSDELDNDGDGFTDTLDTEDCPTELSNGEIPECADGSDNDGDGLRDSDDPDCMDGFDDSEVPECSDGVDNDGDNDVDDDDEQCVYGPEHDCEGLWECPDKTGLCENGWDDDGDGYVDFADSDCIGGVSEIPACDDGEDNDGDLLVDLNDPDCDSLTGRGELPDCYDELDNDMDGLVDLADPGCTDKHDLKELPECSDGLDNDGDGTADFNPPSAQEINGSFEQGYNPKDLWRTLSTGSNSITGWQVTGSVDWKTGYWQHSHGSRSLDLNGEYPGAVYRTINTSPGVTYEVGFDLAGNPNPNPVCPEPIKVMRVTAAGTQEDFTFDTTGKSFSDMGWDPRVFTFLATETTTELRFASVSPNSWCGPALDNVTVTPLVFPADADCSDAEDNTEAVYECSDGIDNDGDGKIDWDGGPSGQPDHQCTGPRDNTEAQISPPPCSVGWISTGPSAPLLWLGALCLLLAIRRRRRRGRAPFLAAAALGLALMVPGLASAQGSGSEGSGQFTGLSTAPEANPFSGSMSMSVPIEVPPGRKNATPQLGLTYSSSGGSGPFGYGWSLPLGSIERATKYGRPSCHVDKDEHGKITNPRHTRDFVLMLSGGTMELFDDGPISHPDKRRHRARLDESHVEAILDGRLQIDEPYSYNTWKVHDRKGMTYWFGTDPDGADNPSNSDARMFHVADTTMRENTSIQGNPVCEFTSIWGLTRMVDPNGNTVDIKYFKDHNTLYPEEVLYGANPSANLDDHPFKVEFKRRARSTYGPPPGAPAIEQSHRGVRERIEYVIHRIEVSYRPDSSSNEYEPIRAYDLEYTYVESNGRLLLTSVDDDHNGADLLPRQTFFYGEQAVEGETDVATVGFNHSTQKSFGHPVITQGENSGLSYSKTDVGNGITRSHRAVMDVNGDGVSDILDTNGGSGPWEFYPGYVTSVENATTGSSVGFSQTGYTWTGGSGAIGKSYANDFLSLTKRGVLDLTGDGIPDLVDASGTPWQVSPGYCTSPTQCGFEALPDSWWSPVAHLDSATVSDDYSTTQHQLLDVNGDGRPDLSFGDNVYLNTGKRFEEAPDVRLYARSTSYQHPTNGTSEVIQTILDFNGDGLPDQLSGAVGPNGVKKIHVGLNTGRGFSWETASFTMEGTHAIQRSIKCNWGGEPFDDYDTHTVADFFDVNGDGLPDRVRATGNCNWGSWKVRLNQGGRALGPEQAWQGNLGKYLRQTHVDIQNGGDDTASRTWRDVLDINGDGLLDVVDKGGTVHLGRPDSGPAMRPLLLVRAENGIGGVTEVSYARSASFDHTQGDPNIDGGADHDLPFNTWVVTKIVKSDGLSAPLEQTFHYEGGLFDVDALQFRGFHVVTKTDSDQNRVVTTYAQDGCFGGKVLVRERYAGTERVARETSTWGHSDEPLSCGSPLRTQIYLLERKSQEFAVYPRTPSLDRCVFNRNEPPDEWGRVTHTCSLAGTVDGTGVCTAPGAAGSCATAEVGQVDTETSWAYPQTGVGSFVRERPRTVETSYIDASENSTLLEKKEFFYDGIELPASAGDELPRVTDGNVTHVKTLVGPAHWTHVYNDYDDFGNIISVTDANGHESVSVYNPGFFSLYPFAERNARNQWIQTETDLRFGKPTKKTGANGEEALTVYDGLGRPTCEAGPGEDLDDCHSGANFTHSKEYDYHWGNPAAGPFEAKLSYVEVRTREPNAAGGHLVSRQYTDGFHRKRVATTQQVIGASNTLSTVVAEHLEYGQGGRVSRKYVPYELTSPLVQSPSVDCTTGACTAYDYHLNGTGTIDPQGRAHRVTAPDQEQVLSFYQGRQTETVNAQGTALENRARTTQDHFGRLKTKESFVGGATTPTTWFENTYDGIGRVLTELVSGVEATRVTHTYDLLGRETSLVDPDSGQWTFVYDDHGNVVSRNDPEPDQHVQWVYDSLNRVTHVCTFENDEYVGLEDDCGIGIAESVYTYDDPSAGSSEGRLTRVDDLSGFEEFNYDIRGRVTEQTRSIGGSETALSSSDAIEATMRFEYDAVDRVVKATYPDGQVVDYDFNVAGQLLKVRSGGNYVSAIHYDLFGRTEKVTRGNGVQDVRGYYGAAENFRLASIEANKGVTSHLDLDYNYNALGKVSQIDDQRNPSGDLSNSAIYTYDPLGRLTDVNGVAHSDSFDYDPVGNIIEKGSYDLNYDDPIRPHRLTSYHGKSYDYSENGERTFKDAPGTANDQAYEYDELGRVTRVTVGNDTVDYAYDYAGRRVAKRVADGGIPGAWTRYFSDAVESEVDDEGNGWLVKYYFAGDARIAVKRALTGTFVDESAANPIPFTIPPWVWILLSFSVVILFLGPGAREVVLGVRIGPARALGSALLVLTISGPALVALTGCPGPTLNPDVHHYHTDHLGSTQVVTDKTGTIVQQVRYEPYGEIRGRFGPTGTVLPENDNYRHEFTGYETELESGLQYAGARYFDPETAQFLSHDPERQYASPYAYGPGDPVNGTDPDGRFWEIVALVLIVAGAIAAGVDAYVKTGSLKAAFTAGFISLSVGLAAAGIGYAVAPVVSAAVQSAGRFGQLAVQALKVGMLASGAHGVVQSARSGNYATAVVGAAALGFAAYAFAAGPGGESTAQATSGETPEGVGGATQGQNAQIAQQTGKELDLFFERPDGSLAHFGGQATAGAATAVASTAGRVDTWSDAFLASLDAGSTLPAVTFGLIPVLAAPAAGAARAASRQVYSRILARTGVEAGTTLHKAASETITILGKGSPVTRTGKIVKAYFGQAKQGLKMLFE